MEALLSQLPSYITGASVLVTSLVVIATIVAKLTPTLKDDIVVGKVKKVVLKIVKYLPTFGINPQTKKLEKALDELSSDKVSNSN